MAPLLKGKNGKGKGKLKCGKFFLFAFPPSQTKRVTALVGVSREARHILNFKNSFGNMFKQSRIITHKKRLGRFLL